MKRSTNDDLLEAEFLGTSERPKSSQSKPSVKRNFKSDFNKGFNETKVFIKNAVDMIETFSLAVVTGFAIYGSLHYQLRNEYKYSVLFSGVVVGLRAFQLLAKFLKRR